MNVILNQLKFASQVCNPKATLMTFKANAIEAVGLCNLASWNL